MKKVFKWALPTAAVVLTTVGVLLYFFLPYAVRFPSRVAKRVFSYPAEDISVINIRTQATHSFDAFGKTAYIDRNTGDVEMRVNRVALLRLKNRLTDETRQRDAASGITQENDTLRVPVKEAGGVEQIADVHVYVRRHILQEMCRGTAPEDIRLTVDYVDRDTGALLFSANWPDEEYDADPEGILEEEAWCLGG